MNTFHDRKSQICRQILDAEEAYLNVYYQIVDMIEDGLLSFDEYNYISNLHLNTADVLTENIMKIIKFLNKLDEQKKNSSLEG